MVAAQVRLGILVVIAAFVVGFGAGWLGRPPAPCAVIRSQGQLESELFEAVRSWLARRNVPPRDMPRRIIKIQELGPGRYRVHMAMGQGEGWFEVQRSGQAWEVRGLQPPAGP